MKNILVIFDKLWLHIYVMANRRVYKINITINDRQINTVIIDPHYELRHKESIDDDVILELVSLLDKKTFIPDAERDGFQYFKSDPLILNGIYYRLIWLLENNELYIGVVNAFRR